MRLFPTIPDRSVFIVVLLVLSLLFSSITYAENAAGQSNAAKVKKIIDAHNLALKYHAMKSPKKYDPSWKDPEDVMKENGVDDIIDKKPDPMTDAEYVGILNDYAFFLGNSFNVHNDTEQDLDRIIHILKRVILLSPERTVAHLNMGDMLVKKLGYQFNYQDKVKAARDIETHYRFYKDHSIKKIDRVEKFLAVNISKDTSNDIGDYIVHFLNKGCGDQIFAIVSEDQEKPTLCDINNDGKREFIAISKQNEHYSNFYIKTDIEGEWLNIYPNNGNEWDMVYKSLVERMKPEHVPGPERDYSPGYPNFKIVPYRDGIFYIRCNSFGTILLTATRLEGAYGRTVCVFESSHTNKHIVYCKDKPLCDYITNQKKLNYVSSKEKKQILESTWFEEEKDRQESLNCSFHNIFIDPIFKPFKFNNKLYIEAMSNSPNCPLEQIWGIVQKGNKKELRKVIGFNYSIINKVSYREETPDIAKVLKKDNEKRILKPVHMNKAR